MPFMKDYRCSEGHVTEYLHMGSSDTLPPSIECRVVTVFKARSVGLSEIGLGLAGAMNRCGKQAEPVISPVVAQTIVRGNGDFAERERERLTKRSNEHWQREGRDEAVDRERKAMGFSTLVDVPK